MYINELCFVHLVVKHIIKNNVLSVTTYVHGYLIFYTSIILYTNIPTLLTIIRCMIPQNHSEKH